MSRDEAIIAMVDEGKITMRPAVERPYLPPEAQQSVLEAIESEECPSHVQAAQMRKYAEEGRLDEDVILCGNARDVELTATFRQ